MKRLYTTLVLFFIVANSFAQQKTLMDSSYNYLSDKYYEFKGKDSIKAKFYADVYLKKAVRKKDTNEMTSAYLYKSELLKNDSIYINFLDKLILLTSRSPNKLYPASFYYSKWSHFFTRRINQNLALKEILLAKKYSEKTKNDSLQHLIDIRIALMFSEAGDRKKSIELYKNSYKYYKNNPLKISNNNLFSLLYSISKEYSRLQIIDSAIYYNDIAYGQSMKTKDSIMASYSLYRKGVLDYQTKNYRSAAKNIEKSISGIISDENYMIVSGAYSQIARSYKKLNNEEKVYSYYNKVDSLYIKRKKMYNSTLQSEAFKYLHDHYKKENNLTKQLSFLNKILIWDSIAIKTSNNLRTTLYREYDKPKLIAEREQIIKKLKSNSNRTKYSLVAVSGIILFLFGYQYRRRKQLKKRFEEVVRSKNKREARDKRQETEQNGLSISKELVKKVLNGLDAFEKNYKFTNAPLSLQSLANDLDTNANYLSKIINHYKELSFSQYINELRINHVLELLDTDSRIRKYSIKGIAEEIGYKNAESFSNAFYKKTGLRPSYYIRQLEKADE